MSVDKSYTRRRGKVISISIPRYLIDFIDKMMREKHYKTRSEFIRYVLHLYQDKFIVRKLDTVSKEEMDEANKYKMKKHFEDIGHLSQLIANTIISSKKAGVLEDE
jgi:Arc/MetJ-type ribon-helix-helix transcriptional regulator